MSKPYQSPLTKRLKADRRVDEILDIGMRRIGRGAIVVAICCAAIEITAQIQMAVTRAHPQPIGSYYVEHNPGQR